MKYIIDFISYLLFLFFYFIFIILPYRFSHILGYLIIIFVSSLLKKYPKIIYNNLQNAFPNKDKEFYKEIYKKNLKYMGRLIADTFLKSKMNEKWFKKYIHYNENTTQIENQILKQLQKNEPVIIISGHLGNWEDLAQYLGYRFPDLVAIIYKKIKNRYLDQWFYQKRALTGAKLYSMENTLNVIKFIEKGKILAIAPDQNAGGAGIMIPFLNRPASTYKGPALIGYMVDAHIYFTSMMYSDNGKLYLVYDYIGKITKKEKEKYTKDEFIEVWTKKWVNALEKQIEKNPEQYFWVHQRWKTTPEIMKKLQEMKEQKKRKTI